MIDFRMTILQGITANDWTAAEFARRVGDAGGPTPNTVYRFLRGEMTPNARTLRVMLEVLDVELLTRW